MAFKTLKPAAWLLPQPVLMIGTYDADGNPDVMNAVWGGMYDGDLVELCLSEGHKTTHNIWQTGNSRSDSQRRRPSPPAIILVLSAPTRSQTKWKNPD